MMFDSKKVSLCRVMMIPAPRCHVASSSRSSLIPSTSPRLESIQLLGDLAEVVGGYRVADMGSVVPLEWPERLQRLDRLAGEVRQNWIAVGVARQYPVRAKTI